MALGQDGTTRCPAKDQERLLTMGGLQMMPIPPTAVILGDLSINSLHCDTCIAMICTLQVEKHHKLHMSAAGFN